MATITAGDFRNGKTFEMDGKVMQVVESSSTSSPARAPRSSAPRCAT